MPEIYGPSYVYKAHVLRIIDGDTVQVSLDLGFNIVMQKQSIRLAGINCPELLPVKEPSKKWSSIQLMEWMKSPGFASKQALASWLGFNLLQDGSFISDNPPTLVVRTIKDADDKYGRILGYFHVQGPCVVCGGTGKIKEGTTLVPCTECLNSKIQWTNVNHWMIDNGFAVPSK